MLDDKRLLVVDDEEVICQACRRIFSALGCQVDTITDPIEGLCLAIEQPYDAVLLDVKMVGLDGINFLDRLRNAKPALPVVMVTGHPSVHHAAAAVRLKASDYVTKPFTPEEIVHSIRRSLESSGRGEAAANRTVSTSTLPWTPDGWTDSFLGRVVASAWRGRRGTNRRGPDTLPARGIRGGPPAEDRRDGLPGSSAVGHQDG